MPGFAAGLALLLVNLGLVAAVLALSPTLRGARASPPATDQCFVCATAEPETTVSDYPVCAGCETEYFQTGR